MGQMCVQQDKKVILVEMNWSNRILLAMLTGFFALFYGNLIGQEITIDELQDSIKRVSSKEEKFNLELQLGERYLRENIAKADSIGPVLLRKSQQLSDSARFNALFYNSRLAKTNGDLDSYFNTIVSCQPFLSKLKSDDIIYKLYLHLGYYHANSLEMPTAEFYLDNALKIAKKEKNNQRITKAYMNLAYMKMWDQHKDSALMYVNKAIGSARLSNNKRLLSQAFNTQAEIYDYFGQVELSVAKNLVALQLAEETTDVYHMAKFARQVGEAQDKIESLNDAEYYFNRSKTDAIRVNDVRQVGLADVLLADVLRKRKKYEEAIKSCEDAIELLTQKNDLNSLGEAHVVLGRIFREQKKFDDAVQNYNQSLVYFESANNIEMIADAFHDVGTVFLEQKKYQTALNYLERSIEIREKGGSTNEIYETYRVISQLYDDTNRPVKALEYLQKYLDYMDNNTTVQAATKVAELSESYRAEQRERYIQLQKDSIERQKQERVVTDTKLENSQLRNSLQQSVIVALIILSILAGVILFYRWNQNKIRQQQKEAEMSQTLLRAQMNPHFVFNAMSVIQSYIYENDTKNSTKFLVNFSRLMRLILENSPKEFIPIRTEVEILEKYLAMQKLRFEDRFEYFIETDQAILDEFGIIPPMITQPFIENSIEHGQLHTVDGGYIKVDFKKVNGMLEISISDNGIGIEASKQNKKSSAHKSMAMTITSDRIENLNKKYKTTGYMKIEDRTVEGDRGTRVQISLPYKIETNPIS